MNTAEANSTELQNEAQKTRAAAPKAPSRYVALGLTAAAVVLGVVIYTGIRERALAESRLGTATELAAVATVVLPIPTPAPLLSRSSCRVRPSPSTTHLSMHAQMDI